MSGVDTFASALAMMGLALPVLLVLGLVLRGTGGLQLSPTEGVFVAVALTVAGVVRSVYGVFTLDDALLAPILLAMPIAAGIRFGSRVAVASSAASWLLLAVLALANRTFASEGAETVGVGPLAAAAAVSVLAGLYAAAAARRSRTLALAPALLMAVPAFAHPSGAFTDPGVWIGVVACAAWATVMDVGLRSVSLPADVVAQ